jgi:hypothetical protein
MATDLRVEEILDGVVNFIPWKERITLILQENDLWDIVENTKTILVTVPIDATLLEAYTKKNIKAKIIILDSINDHVIPHVTGKSNAYEMWDSLTNLYQSSNENKKMVLREKLKGVKMTKVENVTTYLTKITQVKDDLGVVGEVVVDSELVRTSLNGVTKQWNVFIEGIVARENIPKWDRLWDELIQEETQRGCVFDNSSTSNEEANVDLAPKGKNNSKGQNKQKGEGKIDMRKF